MNISENFTRASTSYIKDYRCPDLRLVKVNGGHSIAVYQQQKDEANNMIAQGRVDFIAEADYSKNSIMEKTVFAILDQINAADKTICMHLEHKNIAENDLFEKQIK